MSVAPAPSVRPQPQGPRPEILRPKPHKPSNLGLLIGLGIALLMLGAAALFWQRRASVGTAVGTTPVTTVALGSGGRTARAVSGTIEKTIWITGVTAAENYAALVTPQLRGSHSDRLRDTSAASTTSASSPGAPPASSSSASSSNATPATRGASNGSSAFQSATSRFGGTLRGSSSGASGSRAASTPSTASAMGASGVGSTSNSLPGGGGGGNGPGDFALVLQHATPGGSHVHKGDVVAEFDRQYMLLRLDDYKASVTQSEAALKKQQAELDITQQAHNQLIGSSKGALEKARLDLKTVPVLSAIDAERAKLAFGQAEAKYQQLLNEVKFVRISQDAEMRNANLDLAQAKLELNRAEVNADQMIVKAPIDGVIVMQSKFRGAELAQIQEGDQLWPGMFFMQVVNPSSMVMNAIVNQVDSEKIRVGSQARIRFDAYPGLVLPGHVVSIAAVTKPGGSRPNFVKRLPVQIKVDGMDRKVIPDLSASAEIILDRQDTVAATVPLGAIFEEGSLGKTFVMVQEPSGWRQREVELGASNNLMAAVKKGLRPGEVVALDRTRTEGKNQGTN